MKKNKMRVIQISGLRGILSAGFVVVCLIAGFVGFPSIMLCKLWNYIAQSTGTIPYINIFQGLILWAIIALTYLILNKKQRYLVAFEPKTSNREIHDIINEIKAQSADLQQESVKNFETQEIKVQPPTGDKESKDEKSKEVV